MVGHYTMQMGRAAFLLALLALAPRAARAQAAAPDNTISLRLEDLLRMAEENNPTLHAAELEAEALATRPRQVSALPDPTVAVGYRPFAITGIDGAVPGEVMVEQMIPYPGKRQLAGKAASFDALAAARETDALALDLAYEVKLAYYELYRVQEQDRLIESFQKQLGGFEEAAAVKYEVGQGTQQAVLKAQLEKNTLARRRLDLAAMRREQLESLARLTNQSDLAAGSEQLVLERPDIGASLDAVSPSAIERLPEAKAIQASLREAEVLVELARLEYRPDFMVGVGLMDMMGMGGASEPLDYLGSRFGVEVGVVLPLQRGKRDAALQEARLRQEQLEARFEALRIERQTEFNTLHQHLEETARALALFESTLLPQAEITLEATLSAYTTGRTEFLDLLDAQRMLFDLRMEYEDTYASYMKARAALERTLGVPSLAQPSTVQTSPADIDADVSARDR